MKKLFSLSFLFFIAFSLRSQCPINISVLNSNGLTANKLSLQFDSSVTPDSTATITLDFGTNDSRSDQYDVTASGRTWETQALTKDHFKGNLDALLISDNNLCSFENGSLKVEEPYCSIFSKWQGSCKKHEPIWRTGNVRIGGGYYDDNDYKLKVIGNTYVDEDLTIEGGTGLGIMTTEERVAYDIYRDGILVFDSDTKGLYISTNEKWMRISTNSNTKNYSLEGSVALIAVAGQSNASGNGTNFNEPILLSSFPNVYTMETATRNWVEFQPSLDNRNVYNGYYSKKPNPVNAIAQNWQTRKNQGENLPDLYILNVSTTNQSFSYEGANCRWNPFAYYQNQECLDPPLNLDCTWPDQQLLNPASVQLDVSLFNLLDDALQKGVEQLLRNGHKVMYMGTVWSQWESDAESNETAIQYATNLVLLRQMIDKAVGIEDSNFFYYFPRSEAGIPSARTIITNTYIEFEESEKNIYRIDLIESLGTNESISSLFISDFIHYDLDAQNWGGERVLEIMLDDAFVIMPARLP